MSEQKTKRFLPTDRTVRKLGRTRELKDTLWLVHSGTGAEFTFWGRELSINIRGDSMIGAARDTRCRIGIYVNGRRMVDDILDRPEKVYKVWDTPEQAEAVIRIVKLSEASRSMAGIGQIETDAEGIITPTENAGHFIEFIGDSITCGYGVDDEVKEHSFSTSTEDVTKAYAYQTAKALNADYSMVCISGYGIISGYTDCGRKEPQWTVPPYYEKLGFSGGIYLDEYSAQEQPWDFSSRQPDVVVINLGTNDNSYTMDKPKRREDYRQSYVEFLKVVRRNNPRAVIVCVLGIMGEQLCPCVEQAVADFRSETGDDKVYYMGFADQDPADGYVADWHPTERTHNKAAVRLTAELKRIMKW